VTTTLLSKHFPIEMAQLFSILCTAIALLVNIPATFLAAERY
jgi:ABC-type lipoprotein release transport system permease subunit